MSAIILSPHGLLPWKLNELRVHSIFINIITRNLHKMYLKCTQQRYIADLSRNSIIFVYKTRFSKSLMIRLNCWRFKSTCDSDCGNNQKAKLLNRFLCILFVASICFPILRFFCYSVVIIHCFATHERIMFRWLSLLYFGNCRMHFELMDHFDTKVDGDENEVHNNGKIAIKSARSKYNFKKVEEKKQLYYYEN